MTWNPVAKLLLGLGVVLILVGLFWQFGARFLPLGRLPGDIAIEKPGFRFYFPLGTSILLSLLFTLISYLISWFRR